MPWDGTSHQPRANIAAVNSKNSQVNTCNAGAMANPADVPLNMPSQPATTHHQGSGSNPLSRLTNGFSTCNRFI